MTQHDLVGIGLGPFNLGLACLSRPLPELDAVFCDERPEFDWHPGMLLPDATLQTPFLADLVTLADPTSPLSFLAYLKQTGRLYPFYIRESFFPLRAEFRDYCRWAAAQLPSLRFGHRVTRVEYDPAERGYTVRALRAADGARVTLRARHLVVGTGTQPWLPPACRGLSLGDAGPGPLAVHSAGYLPVRERLRALDSVTVVGSGQSAAEIVRDLLDTPADGPRVTWLTRSPRFFPLEYTKLTLELTSPDYVDYFHALPEETRYRLRDEQKALFKGINSELVNGLYDLLYRRAQAGRPPARLLSGTALESVTADPAAGEFELGVHHREQGRRAAVRSCGLVLATGYRHRVPEFLAPVADRIRRDSRGGYQVARNYSIDVTGRGIFLQNAATHAHSITSPDLGMGAHRNARILAEILGTEPYPVEKAIAFQEFGLSGAGPGR